MGGTILAVMCTVFAIIAAFAPLAAPELFFFISVPLLVAVFARAFIL
jgi:hypothetical protein